MKRPRLIAFCVLSMLLFVAGSGFVLSQEFTDAYNAFLRGYDDEFYQTEEQNRKRSEYFQFTEQLRGESLLPVAENAATRTTERLNALHASGTYPTMEETTLIRREIQVEASFDITYTMHLKLAEKEKELFPDVQERQQRQFQLQESISRRLESLDDPGDIFTLVTGMVVDPAKFTQPDFLELTPEQRDLIKEIQKETLLKFIRIHAKSGSEQPEKQGELEQLVEKNKTELTDEERNELVRKAFQIEMNMLKGYVPELKAILIEGRESYMRVLTDAQKAKIKAVMDDMPDYMRNLFTAIDKQGGGLSILHNWQPGMGVPGVNPNREAPRERTNTGGGRAFPN